MGGVRVVAALKLIPILGECCCPEIIRKIWLRRRLSYQHTVSRHGALLRGPRLKYAFTVFSSVPFFDHLLQYLMRASTRNGTPVLQCYLQERFDGLTLG